MALDPVQIGFGIVELLRTSDFALLSVSEYDDELSLEASVHVHIFVFIFRRILSGNVIVRVTG